MQTIANIAQIVGLFKGLNGTDDNLFVDTFTWEQLPNSFKLYKPLKPIKYKLEPTNPELLRIVKTFLSTDVLRENLTGINFDEKGITATDANTLIHIPGKHSFDGIYAGKKKIDERYPKYMEVIPREPKHTYKVNVANIKTFVEAVLQGQFTNSTTNLVSLDYAIGEKNKILQIGFNGKYLINVCNALMMLGMQECYVHLIAPNRAAVFTPSKNILFSEPIVLLMPMMLDRYDDSEPDRDTLSQNDIDYGRKLLARYSFITDNIVLPDGSTVEIDKKNTSIDYLPGDVNENYFGLIKKIVPKKPILPILRLAQVSNGTAMVTNLDSFLRLKCNLPDGLYNIFANGLLKTNTEDAESFVKYPVAENTKTIAVCNSFTLGNKIDLASKYVSKDELRPRLMGVNLKITNNNQIEINASDGNVAIHSVIKCDVNSELIGASYIIPEPKILADFLLAENTPITIKLIGDANIQFVAGVANYTVRLIDGKYPDLPSVWPTETLRTIKLNKTELSKALALLKKEDKGVALIAKNNKYYFHSYTIEDVKGESVATSVELFEASVKIIELEQAQGYVPSSLFMPTLPNLELPIEMAMAKDVLKTLLLTSTTNDIDLLNQKPNRGFLLLDNSVEPTAPKRIATKPIEKEAEKVIPEHADSFAQYKKMTTSEWKNSEKTVIIYFINGKQVAEYDTIEYKNYEPLRKAYYNTIEAAIKNNHYQKDIENGILSKEQATEIIKGAGFEVPKNIYVDIDAIKTKTLAKAKAVIAIAKAKRLRLENGK